MPTLVDGSVRLTPSMAICEYLATRHHSPLLVEPGDPERIEFVQWLWYGKSTLMTPLSRIATVTRVGRTGADIDAVLEDARGNAGVRLTALERRLEGRDFLVAGRLTLADISAGYPLHLVGLFGIDHLLGPRTAAYRERLRGAPRLSARDRRSLTDRRAAACMSCASSTDRARSSWPLMPTEAMPCASLPAAFITGTATMVTPAM